MIYFNSIWILIDINLSFHPFHMRNNDFFIEYSEIIEMPIIMENKMDFNFFKTIDEKYKRLKFMNG